MLILLLYIPYGSICSKQTSGEMFCVMVIFHYHTKMGIEHLDAYILYMYIYHMYYKYMYLYIETEC